MNEYVAEPVSAWFMWVFGLGAVSTSISWLIFAPLTMRRIEKQMRQDGMPEGFIWDGIGGRVVFYAYAILFPEKGALRIERLIDVRCVRSYATKADWWRSSFFVTTSHLRLSVTFITLLLDAHAPGS